MRIIRRRKDERLLNPFHLRQAATRARGATQLYWVGYIAAAGRLFLQGSVPTLVLAVDRRDADHVTTLIEDLCSGHPTCEWCESNHDGLQAYIRDRDLAQMLAEWGTPGADPTEGSVPVALIPGSLLPHFVRGYLEGGRGNPPFGLQRIPSSLAAVRVVALEGPEEFLAGLRTALTKHAGVGAGVIRRRRGGLSVLTYRGTAAKRIVQFAYHNAERSIPRTASLRHVRESSPSSNGAAARAR